MFILLVSFGVISNESDLAISDCLFLIHAIKLRILTTIEFDYKRVQYDRHFTLLVEDKLMGDANLRLYLPLYTHKSTLSI